MKTASWITLIYGLLVLTGGIMGFVKASSRVSLIAGGLFGILLIVSSFGMMKDHLLPAYFSLIVVLILDAFFTYRWLITFKWMPAGLMAVISLGVLVSLVFLLKNHLKVGN